MIFGVTTIDLGDGIANVLAAIALIISVISIFVANARATESNARATESNQIALDANSTAREARDIAQKANDISQDQYNLALDQHTREQQQKYRVALRPMLAKLNVANSQLQDENRPNDELASIPLCEGLDLYPKVTPLLSSKQAGKIGPASQALRYAMKQWLDLRTANKIKESIPLDQPMNWSSTATSDELAVESLFRLALVKYYLALLESSVSDNYMKHDFQSMSEVLEFTYQTQELYLRINPAAANSKFLAMDTLRPKYYDIDFGPYGS